MSDIERRAILGAAGIGALAAIARAGGPLNPPGGGVASSGRTLDEVYNKIVVPPPIGGYDGRIPIPGGTTPVTISQPGSYVLTGDITIPGATNAITIAARGVTLDLNGYGLSSDTGVNAVEIQDPALNTVVRNGRISGFVRAVNIPFNSTSGHVLEDLQIRGCTLFGVISFGRCTFVRRCAFVDLGGGTPAAAVTGVYLLGSCSAADQCTIERFASTAAAPAYVGIRVDGSGCAINRCTISHNAATAGTGVQMMGSPTVYRDNTVINLATKYLVNAGVTAVNAGTNA